MAERLDDQGLHSDGGLLLPNENDGLALGRVALLFPCAQHRRCYSIDLRVALKLPSEQKWLLSHG